MGRLKQYLLVEKVVVEGLFFLVSKKLGDA